MLHPGKQSQRRQHWMPTLGSISPCQDASSGQLSFLLAGAWGIPVPTGIAQTFNLPSLENRAATGLRQEVARDGLPWWRGGRIEELHHHFLHKKLHRIHTLRPCEALSKKCTKHRVTNSTAILLLHLGSVATVTDRAAFPPSYQMEHTLRWEGFIPLPQPQSRPSSLLLLSTNTLTGSLNLRWFGQWA